MKRILQNKFLQVFGVSGIIFLLIYFFLKVLFYNINGEFLYFIKKTLTEKVNPNIIVVEIDDLTYNKLGFPLDRSDYIPFLKNINKASPAVVGFDILFLDKGKDPAKDILLAKQFKELGNVVIGADTSKLTKVNGKNYVSIIKPYDLFNASVKNIGYFQATINADTNKVYSLKPYNQLNYNGKVGYFESFSFSILREYYNTIYRKNNYEIAKSIGEGFYEFFHKKIPTKGGEFYISFKDVNSFTRESFYNIYTGNFDSSKFKDKIVLVGYTAEGVKDDFLLPGIGKGGTTKGVYVHANSINNVLNDNYVIFFNELIEKGIGLLFIMFIVYLNIFHLKHLNLRWIGLGAIFLFLFVALFYVIFFISLYKQNGIYLLPNYPFEFITVLFLSFFVSAVLKYMNEDKNKKLLSQALSEYVSSDIAREILHSTGEVKLSGENKKITIFFSDIAGFTTISEKMSPEDLVAFLRVYLGEMSNIILDNKGFINKYEGDAIMALWGVFGQVENFGVVEACKSCLLQQARLKALNEIWKVEGKDQLSVRMGLHTGPAIIGNIGAAGRKMEFTALGDSVNLGSRLEGVNKFYGTNICVSEDIYNEVKDQFTFRYLDKIRVKGKNIGVNIYELVSYIGEEGDFKKEILVKFEKALNFYFERNFDAAFKIFAELSNLGDNPSKTYKIRCERYLVNPPHEDWDGIWVLDEK